MRKILVMAALIIGVIGCGKDEENSAFQEKFVTYRNLDEVKKSEREFILQINADEYSEFILNGYKIDVSDNIFIALKKGIKYTFKFKAIDFNTIWYRMKYDAHNSHNGEQYRYLYLAKCTYTHKKTVKVRYSEYTYREYISEGEGYFTITDDHEVY